MFVGCENTARLEFPKIPETLNAKVLEEQLYHVLIHEPSIASVPNCALASFIEQSHSCCLLNKRNIEEQLYFIILKPACVCGCFRTICANAHYR